MKHPLRARTPEQAIIAALEEEVAGLRAELASASLAQWIPVSEQLPPRHQEFIALNSDGRIFRSCMCYGMHEPWFTYPRGDSSPSDTMPAWIDVTHWTPLPRLEEARKGGSKAA